MANRQRDPAPHVAGAVALLLSRRKKAILKDPNKTQLNAAQVAVALLRLRKRALDILSRAVEAGGKVARQFSSPVQRSATTRIRPTLVSNRAFGGMTWK